MAGNDLQSWAKVDPSIYALCFTGQAISTENWCSRCQCLDHTSNNCPMWSQKRPWSGAAGSPQQAWPSGQEIPLCLKYNRFDGDCKFGSQCRCRYAQVCSSSDDFGGNTKWRLIKDLSAPEDHSVNDGITKELASLTYNMSIGHSHLLAMEFLIASC